VLLDDRGAPAAERASVHLRWLLFEGRIRPGDRIDQDEIAASLGISRQPVREAVLGLASEGLLLIRPRKGVFVGRFDAKLVRGHYELNGYLEAYAAAKVAGDPRPETIVRLRALVAAMHDARDLVALETASTEFYRAINLASGNPRIGDALRLLQRFVPGPVYERYPSLIGIGRRGAAAVLAAIQARDPDAAGHACMEQWRAGGEVIVEDLVARGIVEGR
jgi:DNA-binding GntR family transcriptional regulator